MQYEELPLLILLLSAIYLTAIYIVLKLAERQPQEDSSSSIVINSKQ